MTDSSAHAASRVIIAPARSIFRAFLDAESIAAWKAPRGMTAKVLAFDARVGGGYRIILAYADDQHGRGKSTPNADIVTSRFLELIPNEKIVEGVVFETDDPDFAGTMTISTTFTPVIDGTKVMFVAENAPRGISAEDHRTGMDSTLKNLANFLE